MSIDGLRFEIPTRFRHLARVEVRSAAWDFSSVWLVDARTATVLAPLYPLDKRATPTASAAARAAQSDLRRARHPPPARPSRRCCGACSPRSRRRAAARLSPTEDEQTKEPHEQKMQALFGLKWNPFTPDVPVEALPEPPHRSFLLAGRAARRRGRVRADQRRAGHRQVRRAAPARRAAEDCPTCASTILSRPQAAPPDFYRELGDLFGVTLSPHNRWASTKVLRECWQAHIEPPLFRPVLLVDEAQEMLPAVLGELRLLSATPARHPRAAHRACSAGDSRLLEKLRLPRAAAPGQPHAAPASPSRPPPRTNCASACAHAGGRRQPPAAHPGADRHARRSRRRQPPRADEPGAELLAAAVEREPAADRREALLRLYNPPRRPLVGVPRARAAEAGDDAPAAVSRPSISPPRAPSTAGWSTPVEERAVGILGGEPKCGKSMLALEIAVAVASGAPCLRRFAVERPGRVLLFAAEDAPGIVRRRLDGICHAAQLDLAALDLHLITAPVLRLDLATDQARLEDTVKAARAPSPRARSLRAPAPHRRERRRRGGRRPLLPAPPRAHLPQRRRARSSTTCARAPAICAPARPCAAAPSSTPGATPISICAARHTACA